jgi:acyl-CoA thioesterase-1
MNKFIWTTAILCFTFSIIFLSACGGAGASSVEMRTDKTTEKPLASPPTNLDKPKIVAFGDSLTAGFGLTEKESYPFLLQQKLNADGFDYEVINAGVSGETSFGGTERVDWVLEQENVSILILELGANDLLRRVPVPKMKENLSKIIEKAQAKAITVLLCGMLAPPNAGAQYQRDYVAVFPDLANRYKVAFMPFILEGIALNPQLNQPDGIHPNSEGEKIMTENVYKALKPLLKQRQ